MSKDLLPDKIKAIYPHDSLRPSQEKAIKAGLFKDYNLVVCTPTGSGKTQVAEFAFLNYFFNQKGKAVYVVPLKALAQEKYKEFKEKYSKIGLRVAISIGDTDEKDTGYLKGFDILITTSEKLDSLIRHKSVFIDFVKLLIIDEIHLLNDVGRGPTLEMVITMMKVLHPDIQVLGLSATIGNPEELADWLDAKLVEDDFRPCKLHQGIYLDGEIEFED